MATSILDETRLTLAEAAQRLDIHVATAWRWTAIGVRGRKLPSIVIGGRRFVLESDLEAWLQDSREGRPQRVDDAELRWRAERADAELDQTGW